MTPCSSPVKEQVPHYFQSPHTRPQLPIIGSPPYENTGLRPHTSLLPPHSQQSQKWWKSSSTATAALLKFLLHVSQKPARDNVAAKLLKELLKAGHELWDRQFSADRFNPGECLAFSVCFHLNSLKRSTSIKVVHFWVPERKWMELVSLGQHWGRRGSLLIACPSDIHPRWDWFEIKETNNRHFYS